MLYTTELPAPIMVEEGDEAARLRGKVPGLHIMSPSRALERLQNVPVLGADTETTGLLRHKDHIVFWSLSDGRDRFCLPRRHLPLFAPLLQNPELTLAGQTFNYDRWMFLNSGVDLMPRNIPGWRRRYRTYDTATMHALIADNQDHDLKSMAKHRLGVHMKSFRETFKSAEKDVGKKLLQFYDTDPYKVIDYASMDAWATYRLWEEYATELDQMEAESGVSLLDYYLRFEQKMHDILWQMERTGVLLDHEACLQKMEALSQEREELRKEICRVVGRVVNVNSPAQLVPLFYSQDEKGHWFDADGNKPAKFTSGGDSGIRKPSVDKEVLAWLAKRSNPAAAKLQRYRQIDTIIKYLKQYYELADKDWRIHTTFQQWVAATGRLSSKGPNLQNVKRDEDEFGVRKLFVPGTGKLLGDADYCFATGTLVQTTQGPTPIEQLRPGDLVFTYRKETRRPAVSRVNQLIRVGTAPVLKITLDNGKTIRCTREHKFYVCPIAQNNDPELCLAGDLRPGDRLLPLKRVTSNYVHLYAHKAIEYSKEHVEVARAALGEVPEGHHVHHKDENSQNNRLENLEYSPKAEHLSEHSKRTARRCWDDPEVASRMREGISRSIQKRGGYHGANNPRFGDRRQRLRGTCLLCNREFEYFRTQSSGKYCSRACYSEGRRVGLNHKVVSVEPDGEDVVWSIGVDRDHNYALEAGVFVGNSQLEMRIAASVADEPNLIRAILEGKDLHCWTAHLMHGIPYEDLMAAVAAKDAKQRALTQEEKALVEKRLATKSINFGVMYGETPIKLSKQLGIPKPEAEVLFEGYWATYPGLRSFFDWVENYCNANEYICTPLGRRRQIPQVRSFRDSRKDYSAGIRAAGNHPIQGHAAEITKGAQIRIYEDDDIWSAGLRMTLQVHDEIVSEGPAWLFKDKDFIERYEHYMRYPFGDDEEPLAVPLQADLHSGDSWGSAK